MGKYIPLNIREMILRTHAGLCSSDGDSGMEARVGSWLTSELIILEAQVFVDNRGEYVGEMRE